MSKVSEPADLALARHIRELEMEIEPSRDLWAGIERKIIEHPQRKKFSFTTDWMPYGVAASVLMAFSALLLNLMQFNSPNAYPDLTIAGGLPEQSLETLQVEYLKTRTPLINQFTETNRNLAPETLEELYRNIEIMEQARRQIEAEVRLNPNDRLLVERLMRVHEQELELLKQDYSRPGRSM